MPTSGSGDDARDWLIVGRVGKPHGVHGDLLVEDDLIREVSEHRERPPGGSVDRVIDASGKLVMPGLVNAHLHSYDVYMKGMYEGLPLEPWMPYLSLSARRPFSQHEIYVRTQRVAAEMLRNGITTAHDFLKLFPLDQDSLNTVMQAYQDVGIRVVVGVDMGSLRC